MVATEQNGMVFGGSLHRYHPLNCNAQISVNSRRAVLWSVSILPSKRSNSWLALVMNATPAHIYRLYL